MNKKYIIYLVRWQLSGLIIAPCIYFLHGNAILSSVVGNLLGGIIFWFVDKWIFSKKKLKRDYLK